MKLNHLPTGVILIILDYLIYDDCLNLFNVLNIKKFQNNDNIRCKIEKIKNDMVIKIVRIFPRKWMIIFQSYKPINIDIKPYIVRRMIDNFKICYNTVLKTRIQNKFIYCIILFKEYNEIQLKTEIFNFYQKIEYNTDFKTTRLFYSDEDERIYNILIRNYSSFIDVVYIRNNKYVIKYSSLNDFYTDIFNPRFKYGINKSFLQDKNMMKFNYPDITFIEHNLEQFLNCGYDPIFGW